MYQRKLIGDWKAEGKVLPISSFISFDDYSCGYSSTLVVLDYFKKPVEGLRKELNTNHVNGTSQNSIIRTLRNRGVSVGLRYNVNPLKLTREVEKGHPVVIYDTEYEHWQVLVGVSNDKALIATYDCSGGIFIENISALTEEYGSFGIVCKLK